jgi:UDP-glucose:(heptosyl)LPS alpha-1,3-glucosyltransferase
MRFNSVYSQKSSNSARPKLHLLHVVRRYGPVGGMERYVWNLTRQLQKLGYGVTVVCERCYVDKPEGISVYELGEIAQRPRWLAAMRFDWRVKKWLESNPQKNTVIHSHERISSHDITTFHGSLFATVLEKPWWRLISLRVAMQLYLERRELAVAKCIVPNSQYIKEQLAHYYPEFAHKLSKPVTPGVESGKSRDPYPVPASGGVIGFVGKEWKRKGLILAAAAVKQLRLSRPGLQFVVIGPSVHSVRHLFVSWSGGYLLKEWGSQVDYSELDVLVHPAKSEPYGMVICEAMAAQVPVVVSDVCGASDDVSADAGVVLSLEASIDDWAEAIDEQLKRTKRVPKFERDWCCVAQEYQAILRAMDSVLQSDFSDAFADGYHGGHIVNS